MQVTSPDISNLEYQVLFDLSVTKPAVTITNASTIGAPNNLKWWFDIVTPSGDMIHNGNSVSPDVNLAAFTTKTYDTWPQPMGQVQWGTYTVTVFVKDSANVTHQYSKSATITRPLGNTMKTAGNFGAASVMTNMNCSTGQLYAEDTTPYQWGGVNPTTVSADFILVYPVDASGVQPDNVTRAGANGVFRITESSESYQLVRTVVQSYSLGNNITVKLKFKYKTMLELQCSTDLCRFSCDYQRLLQKADDGCDAQATAKLIQLNGYMNLAILAKMQPDCGIKASDMVSKIKELGLGECDCGPNTTGINGTPTIPGNPTIPDDPDEETPPALEYVDLVTKGLTTPPIECPSNPFPKEVWTPNGNTSLGVAQNITELVAKLSSNTGTGNWAEKGVWAPSGYCRVSLARNSTITGSIPKIPVSAPAQNNCVDNNKSYYALLKNFGNPSGPYTPVSYPLTAYVKLSVGDNSPYLLSNVTSYSDLISKMNAIGPPKIPATISFQPAITDDKVYVVDTDCDGNSAIQVLVEVEEFEEIVYGPSYQKGNGLTSGLFGVDIKNGIQLGSVCGTRNEDPLWHSVRVGNFIYYLDTKPGAIRKADMTNPLSPVYGGEVLLPAIVGTPHAPGSGFPSLNGNPATPSDWDIYFPTDVNSEVKGFLYIVESSSGYIWKYRLSDDTIVATVYDIRLVGRCPRVLLNNILYFSQDGLREPELGLSSGIARHHILALDVSTVVTGGTLTITTPNPPAASLVGTEPWAITLQPSTGDLWITTQSGGLVRWNPATGSSQAWFSRWQVSATLYPPVNTSMYGDRMFMSSNGPTGGTQTLTISSGIPSSPVLFDPSIDLPTGIVLPAHYNAIVPAGKGYVIVTVDGSPLTPNRGVLAIYTLTGKIIKLIKFPTAASMYNVIAYTLKNQSLTPNGLCS